VEGYSRRKAVIVLPEAERRIKIMKSVGVLNVWFEDRNFGFVHVDKDDAVVSHFLHGANIKSGQPVSGATVSFKAVETRKGWLAVDAVIGGAE
jgi:cold shock CspA family protein